MTIAFNDGTRYADDVNYYADRPISAREDLSSSKKGPKRDQSDDFEIDYNHHVPLVASALMDNEGNMTGMVIDHRLKGMLNKKEEELLKLHEGTELPYMNDLVANGMHPSEAYGEAHKWATARETAASIRLWGEDGHEKYKEKMRQAASIASEPTDKPRHLDAHTTRYKLDEAELGNVFPIQGTPEDTLLKYQENRYKPSIFRKDNKEPAKVLPIKGNG